MTSQPFPSQTHVLTTLISSLAQCPPTALSSGSNPPHANTTHDAEAKQRDTKRRSLLLTLHVLFPQLVLPALDLLDRALVAKYLCGGDTSSPAAKQRASDAGSDENFAETDHQAFNGGRTPRIEVYIVRSLASTIKRRAITSALKIYVVHLAAWNCSCASFTFDAFPARPPPSSTQHDRSLHSQGQKEQSVEEGGLSFGGLSLGGQETSQTAGDAPCCKHLLACLLAEQWHGILDSCVEKRIVTREELASIIAGAV